MKDARIEKKLKAAGPAKSSSGIDPLASFCPLGSRELNVNRWIEYLRQIRDCDGFDVDPEVYPGPLLSALR